MTRQKNFSFLIEAFSKIKLSDTILYIAGEGEEKNKLINLINKKKLNDKVKLIGGLSAKWLKIWKMLLTQGNT